MQDVISTTRLNPRQIMLRTDKLSVAQLCKDTKKIVSHPTSVEDKWKEGFLRELLQVGESGLLGEKVKLCFSLK